MLAVLPLWDLSLSPPFCAQNFSGAHCRQHHLEWSGGQMRNWAKYKPGWAGQDLQPQKCIFIRLLTAVMTGSPLSIQLKNSIFLTLLVQAAKPGTKAVNFRFSSLYEDQLVHHNVSCQKPLDPHQMEVTSNHSYTIAYIQ